MNNQINYLINLRFVVFIRGDLITVKRITEDGTIIEVDILKFKKEGKQVTYLYTRFEWTIKQELAMGIAQLLSEKDESWFKSLPSIDAL